MNATTQILLAVSSVAAAAAIGVALANRMATPAADVVKLERVVVVGKRAPAEAPVAVVKLPRVVVEHRRSAATGDTHVAQARQAAPAL